jgi:hypothetical protein
VRGDLARVIVGANLNLTRLESGLEKIYLQLTSDEAPAAAPVEEAA